MRRPARSRRRSIKTACVILAAGLGTRMKSSVPKVLHRVCGVTMIESVVRTALQLSPERIVVVSGKGRQDIRAAAGGERISFAVQERPKGTAHALSCARRALAGFRGTVVVMNGDTPLLTAGTIRHFMRLHRARRNAVSVLSFDAVDPSGYGRIIRDRAGRVLSIVEEKDADREQRMIAEVNSGVYALRHDALSLLAAIRMNKSKGEYYLTDLVAAAYGAGLRTGAYRIGTEEEFIGVNTREDLQLASHLMRTRIIRTWTGKGVHFIDEGSVFIHPDAVVGAGTVIYPGVHLEGRTRIGKSATIYPNVRILDSSVGNGVVIKDCSVIESSRLRDGASVGPFAHLRPGNDIGEGARIGNFVELKKARVGAGTKASHLSYLGDAVIGKGVNVGAGTITCNYDGRQKHRTVISDGVFIGSDTQLVAPVKVGKGAYVGAGSTITADVPAGSLALSRTPQKNILGWAAKKKSSARGARKDKRRGRKFWG